MKKSKKVLHKLAAAMTAGAMMGSSAGAWAAPPAGGGTGIDANALATNLITSSQGFTDMISMLGYVGGSGLSVAGIFKLKQHVDNPGNTPLKDGVMRLAAGGALLSLPFIVSVMQGSISEGNANTGPAGSSIGAFTPGGGAPPG